MCVLVYTSDAKGLKRWYGYTYISLYSSELQHIIITIRKYEKEPVTSSISLNALTCNPKLFFFIW
jgi:hypothetical protein